MTAPDPLTPEQVAELRRLSEAATPGPWTFGDIEGPFPQERIPAHGNIEPLVAGGIEVPDGLLMVAMRNALGPLLDAAEEG